MSQRQNDPKSQSIQADPSIPVRTSQQRILLEVQNLMGQMQSHLSILNKRSELTSDQIGAIANDVQRLRDDMGDVRAQTNPGVIRDPLDTPIHAMQRKPAPLSVTARLEADQEGPQNQPVVRGGIDVSLNVWKAVAIISAIVAIASSVRLVGH